jgi:hypothetical protein
MSYDAQDEARDLRSQLQRANADRQRFRDALATVRAAIYRTAPDTIWMPGPSNQTVAEFIDEILEENASEPTPKPAPAP